MQKKLNKNNFFKNFKLKGNSEIAEVIFSKENFYVERIVSKGYKTDNNEWLSSAKEEWVILVRGNARILFKNGIEIKMKEGDYIYIPKNKKHKVTYTSKKPECFWLAIYFTE